MRKYKLIFAGDLHLCDTLFASHPGMKGDSEFLLSQLSTLCSEHKAGLVLLGDIFDKRFPSPYIVSLFVSYLKEHSFCYIVGQHDGHVITQWPELLSLLTNNIVHHLTEDRVYDFCGVTITGFDYKSKSEVEEIIKKVPRTPACDILCCHQLLKQVWGQEGVWNLDLDWIKPNKIKILALGDWHKTPNEGTYKDFYWAYTGSGLLRSIDEPLNKSCLGLVANGSSLKLERIPLKTRPVIYSEVRSEKQLDKWLSEISDRIVETITKAIEEGIPEEVSKPLVALRFPLDLQGINQIESILKPLIKKADCFFHPMPWKPVGEVEPIISSEVININDIINEFADSTTAPELHNLVSDLISSENPSEVITAFKRRRGIEEI